MNNKMVQIGIIYAIALIYGFVLTVDFLLAVIIIVLALYHMMSLKMLDNEHIKDKDTSVRSLEYRLTKSIQEKEATLEQILSLSDSFSFGLMMLDEEGLVLIANKDMKHYFDIELTGKPYSNLQSISKLHDFVHQSFILESSLRRQIHYKEADYDLISTPLFEKNIFKGCFIIIHDISILKNAEKYQKQFTADVSHELKTPLSTIKGFSEILLRDTDIDVDKRTEFLQLIQDESLRMERLLKDLMIIAQMDRVDYDLEIVATSIDEILDETTRRLAPKIEQKNLTLSKEIEKAIIMVDPYKIQQVFTNLINNAINYTDEGSIYVEGRLDEDMYIVKISDTGIGIKPSQIDKIFKRFYRVDKTRSRKTGGSGLGLSISKNVVLRHGGNIYVDSTPQKGSTFIVELPRQTYSN
jgi:two-component system phosphate regulon sensor histidine kinase PhoR